MPTSVSAYKASVKIFNGFGLGKYLALLGP